ncbi:MAG: type IV secretion system protein [Actinomycetes bacterium]
MPLADSISAAASSSPIDCDGLTGRINPACRLGDLAEQAAGSVAGGAIRELAEGVVGAASEVLTSVLAFVAAPIHPELDSQWYVEGFQRMVSVSALFATVFFLVGLMQSVVHRSTSDLGRVVGFTVGAFAASGIVLYLAQGFIALVDVATAQVAAGAPKDMVQTFDALIRPLTQLTAGSPGQAFLAMLLGLFVALASLAMYVELFIRNVMIHVVVYFLPLMLVGTIWGPTRRWARRAIEFLAVLIFSKFVLYAVVALGWSAVSSFDDQRLTASWGSVLTGLVLLTVAAFMPYLLFKLLPIMEAHVGRALTRHDAGRLAAAPMSPVSSSMRTLDMNLGRAARVAAVFAGGGAGAAVGGALAGAGGDSARTLMGRGGRAASPPSLGNGQRGGAQQGREQPQLPAGSPQPGGSRGPTTMTPFLPTRPGQGDGGEAQ